MSSGIPGQMLGNVRLTMKSIFRYAVILAASMGVTLFQLPSYAQQNPRITIFGHHIGQRRGIDRVIVVTPDTRSVNVVAGETVEFIERRTGSNFIYDFPNERRS